MADRSVSINLRAKVSDFIAGMGQAKRSTEDLSRQMVQTGAYAGEFRRRLEAATKALPKIEIDADSTPAEIKFAELRRQMESLADKKIGIDIDAASAQAQLQEIQRELEALGRQSATVDVKADIGSALAELQALNSEVSRVDGRTANVDVNADVGGALASIALVGGALAALPVVTTVAVGVMALGSAFTAAGVGAAAFSAATVPALGRINQALTAQESAAKSAGAATGGAGQSAAQAAQQAMALEQAETKLKQAQVDRRQAQEDLTRAVEDGRRALQDQNFAMEDSILSQKDATLAVKEAKARLAELQNSDKPVSELELERAMLSVEQAQQRAREQEVKTQRSKKDTAEANEAGVKGTKEYQKGLDNLAQAEQKVKQATDALKTAHLQQQAAMSSGGGGAAKLKDAFADLNSQEKDLAGNIKNFKDSYVDWQRSVEPDTFPVINQGMDLLKLGMRDATPLVKTASSALLTLGKDAETALTGQFWQTFLFNLNTQMPTAIGGLGRSFGNVVTGIAGVVDAFLPFTGTVVGGVETASQKWAEWGKQLKDSPEFHEFIAYVKENAPQVWQLIKDVATALGNIAKAIGPLAPTAFSGLGLLANLVSGMDPAHIQAIALAIGAIKLAAMGMSAAKSWQGLAGGIDATGAAAGKSSGKMAALGKAAIGISAAVIGFEATGAVMSKLSGQSGGIDKLTLALTELGQSGKWSGDLDTQWEHAFDDAGDASKRFGDGLRELQDPSLGEVYWLHPLSEITALLPGLDSDVDLLEQKFSDVDTALAGMVSSGNAAGAAKAFDEFAKQAKDAGIPVEKLKELLPTYGQAVRVAGNASATAATGIDTAKQKVDGFNKSLSEFSGRTDALTAMSNLKTAYNDAEKAINAANGKLQINTKMTDDQRTAVINAREKFAGYIDSVKTAADAAFTLTGRTGESTKTVLEQLPHLGTLAGKNSEAKEQVLLLAKAFGISREDAIKAMKSTEDMEKVLAKLKSKEIKIGLVMDTSAAEKQFGSFIARYSNKSLGIALATKVTATGAIRGPGGVDLMAAGGLKPNIASSATFSPGSRSIYAEAGKEAFIPYDPSNRERAIAILGQVAQDFGLSVYNPNAQQQVTDMVSGLNTANTSITVNLANATRTLDSTLGSSGSLTQTVSGVGDRTLAVGTAVTAVASTMDVGTLKMTASTDKVGVAVSAVADVVVKAANLIASAAAKTGGASAGSTLVPKPTGTGKASAGAVLGYNPNTVDSNGMKPGTYTTGDYGDAGFAGGLVSVQGGYSSASATNSSTVSRAQQLVSSSSASSGSSSGGGSSSYSGGASVNFYGTQIRESMDVDVVTAKIGVAIGGRG